MRVYIAEGCAETSGLMESIIKNAYAECTVKTLFDSKTLVDLIHKEGSPDLLVLGIKISPSSGVDVLKTLRNKNNGYHYFPILMTADITESIILTDAMGMGADDAITKPFNLKDFLQRCQKLINYNLTIKDLKLNIKNLQYEAMINMCKMVEIKDGLTCEHLDRVAEFSYSIALTVGVEKDKCEILRYASKIHDIGKIHIPDNILQKPGPLTAGEFEVIQKHTVIGVEIINTCKYNSLIHSAKDIVLHHHERWDGGGYPYNLKKDEIPLFARIVAVADVFDALTHKRVYKDVWTQGLAIQYISEQREKQFAPDITDAFLSVVQSVGDPEIS
jgi:putative two-component system response regulator